MKRSKRRETYSIRFKQKFKKYTVKECKIKEKISKKKKRKENRNQGWERWQQDRWKLNPLAFVHPIGTPSQSSQEQN